MTLHPFLKLLADAGVYDPPDYLCRPANGHPPGPPPVPGDPRMSRWVTAAVVAECDEIARTPPGGRNHRLNTGAFRLGQLVGGGWLDEHAARDALAEAGLACGLDMPEIAATVRSGLMAGIAAPRLVDLGPPASQIEAAYTLDGVVEAEAEAGAEADDGLPPFVDWERAFAEAALEPEWLIPDVLERGRSHALYAPKKVGKSLVTLFWCDRLIRRGLQVLYVDIENTMSDLVTRLRKMQRLPEHLTALHYLSFPSLAALDTPAGGATLLALREKCAADLVILDTVSRVISGEENSADTFRNLYRYAMVPLKAAGITVLRLDHAGKDATAGQRGSSAKGDDVDTIWRLIRHDNTHYQLKCEAQRSGNHPEAIELVKRGDPKDGEEPPMRFERIEPSAPPEVTALIEQLDRLGLPGEASNRTAREALRAAGVAVRNAVLAEAVRARQVRLDEADPEPVGSNATQQGLETILIPGNAQSDTKIKLSVPQDQLEFDVSPAQRVPGTPGERGEHPPGSPSGERSPTLFPPMGEQGNARRDRPRSGPPDDTVVRSPEVAESPPGLTYPWQPSGDPAKPWLCQRCNWPAERLIGWTRGKWICPVCAYPDPADRPGHDDEEDN